MSKRNSGYARRRHDLYETPAWVLRQVLVPHYPLKGKIVVEPACGRNAQLVAAARMEGAACVLATDIKKPRLGWPHWQAVTWGVRDFLLDPLPAAWSRADILLTNPPYGEGNAMAVRFIERALEWLDTGKRHDDRAVAMLLPVDFDCGVSRRHLFENCPTFEAQIVSRRRIKWFKLGANKDARPSTHHAWFIWSNRSRDKGEYPVKLYGPAPEAGDHD